MSMDKTTFDFNVGVDSYKSTMKTPTLDPDFKPTVDKPKKTEATSRRRLNADDLRIKNSAMSMVNTVFNIDVGLPAERSLRELKNLQMGRAMSVGKLNARMYMYSNSMSMTDTDFSANFS